MTQYWIFEETWSEAAVRVQTLLQNVDEIEAMQQKMQIAWNKCIQQIRDKLQVLGKVSSSS